MDVNETLVVLVSCGCVTNYHKLEGLKQQKYILFTVVEARNMKSVSLGQNQCVSRAFPVLYLFQLLVAAGIPCLWRHHSNLCLHLHLTFSSMSMANLCLPLSCMYVVAFRTNKIIQDNLSI